MMGEGESGIESRRMFIALEISSDVRDALAMVQTKLKTAGTRVKWVPPENIHLTLVFLGQLVNEEIQRVKTVMEQTLSGAGSFKVDVAGIGTFGSAGSPRTVWAGIVAGSNRLIEMQKKLSDGLGLEGFAQEKRPFKPHLTLGRVKPGRKHGSGGGELTSLIDSVKNTTFGHVEVGRAVIFQSRLDQQGATYFQEHTTTL
ncbi:MAG: RNA 2',3'-cyclic phosphodiesterase [Verrucomicrobiota bacterium]